MSVRQAVLFARRRLDSPAGIAAQTRLPLDLVELVLREEESVPKRELNFAPIACRGCFFMSLCSLETLPNGEQCR